jgi:hypothetical protein
MPQLIVKSPSEPAQSTPLPVSLNASFLSPPSHPQQSPEPAPWSLRTRSTGADANHVENAQIPMILTPHFLENQSIHAPFPVHPCFSPATSSARFPTADFTPSLSPHTQDDSLAFLNLSSPSGMQVDLVTTLSAGPGYSGDLSQAQATGHAPSQQATPPASPESQLTEQHPTGKRRRSSVPKDPRAAKRLRSQRQGDDENLEALYKLLVPRSAGVVQKKDRLGTSTSPLSLLFPDDGADDRVFVVIVSSPLCEKVDADSRQFRTAINDLRSNERLLVYFTLAARRVHGESLIS